jgi:hypothetical protein
LEARSFHPWCGLTLISLVIPPTFRRRLELVAVAVRNLKSLEFDLALTGTSIRSHRITLDSKVGQRRNSQREVSKMQKQLLFPPEIMIEVLKSSRSTTPFQLDPGVNLSFQSARGRYDDLLSSALVHRSWTPISQQELFNKISILQGGNELLGRALEESPHLMDYLKDTVAIFIENRSYDPVLGIGSLLG